MKFILFLTCLIGSTFNVNGQATNEQKAIDIQFNTRLIELGEVKKGETKEMQFEFTNVGTDAIEIDLVSSCECTTVEYPRKEIKPGESGKLEVVFDSTEKEESETVDIDIILKNIVPETDAPHFEILNYSFILVE